MSTALIDCFYIHIIRHWVDVDLITARIVFPLISKRALYVLTCMDSIVGRLEYAKDLSSHLEHPSHDMLLSLKSPIHYIRTVYHVRRINTRDARNVLSCHTTLTVEERKAIYSTCFPVGYKYSEVSILRDFVSTIECIRFPKQESIDAILPHLSSLFDAYNCSRSRSYVYGVVRMIEDNNLYEDVISYLKRSRVCDSPLLHAMMRINFIDVWTRLLSSPLTFNILNSIMNRDPDLFTYGNIISAQVLVDWLLCNIVLTDQTHAPILIYRSGWVFTTSNSRTVLIRANGRYGVSWDCGNVERIKLDDNGRYTNVLPIMIYNTNMLVEVCDYIVPFCHFIEPAT
jgi:hypothetical protein